MFIKQLKCGLKKSGGKNNKGRITVFTKSGGHKKSYKYIHFKRNLFGIPAKVIKYVYDSNRNVELVLLGYSNGYLSYILRVKDLNICDFILSGKNIFLEKYFSKLGSVLHLKDINEGSIIHNLEFIYNSGSIFGRTGGTFLQVLKKYYLLKKSISKDAI